MIDSIRRIISRRKQERDDWENACQPVDQNLITTCWLASLRRVWQVDPCSSGSHLHVFTHFWTKDRQTIMFRNSTYSSCKPTPLSLGWPIYFVTTDDLLLKSKLVNRANKKKVLKEWTDILADLGFSSVLVNFLVSAALKPPHKIRYPPLKPAPPPPPLRCYFLYWLLCFFFVEM